jgi:hypothetical protein
MDIIEKLQKKSFLYINFINWILIIILVVVCYFYYINYNKNSYNI